MSDPKTTDLTEQVAQTIYEQWFVCWPPSHPVDLGMDAASFREVAAKVVKLVQGYATAHLLAEAGEFVDFVARTQMDGECFVSSGIALSRADQLRRQADELERADARIARARVLQIKIRDALEIRQPWPTEFEDG